MKERILAGWGNLPQSRSKEYYPRDLADLSQLLQDTTPFIPRGLGRSYADQATNANLSVATITNINHFLDFDEKEGVLECEAGASLEDIIRYLGPRGWFPMITPGTKYVTIGGAIANDVHGKAHHIDGSFINCVISMKVLLANGTVVNASREENQDLFHASFGGLGLLGTIVTAKIQLRKIANTYFKQKSIPVKSLDELLEEIDKADEKYNYSVAWVDSLAKGKSLGKGVLIVGNAAEMDDLSSSRKKDPLYIAPPPKITVPFYMPNFTLNTMSVGVLNKLLYIKQSGGTGISHYENFFYPLDMINEWNRGYGKKGFIQYQFVVPMKNGSENIRKIMKKITESGCVPFLNVLKKFGKSSNGYLSFPMEGYTFAIDFPVTNRLYGFTKEVDAMVLDAGGRIYLGKDAYLDKEMFRKMYPHYQEWISVKRKYDPKNKFSSDISRRLGLEA